MSEVQGIVLIQRSLVAEAAIAFGAPVAEGTTGAGYVREATASLGFAGVALTDPTKSAYAQYDQVKVAKAGIVPGIISKTAAVSSAEAIPEGTGLEVDSVAGSFILAASGTTVARAAESASFASTIAAAGEHTKLILIGA